MKFLVDQCAGRTLAEWLRSRGHDVLEARELGPEPGDRAWLYRAELEGRVLVTIDTDFGELVFLHRVPHAGLVCLPDIPPRRRIALMAELIDQHSDARDSGAVISARSGRIRISRSPAPQ